MSKIEIIEKVCFGGSETHLAFFENNLIITHCGNHLHVYDTVSGTCDIQRLDLGLPGPFSTIGLYQPSFERNDLFIVCCWMRKAQGGSETYILEISPFTFFISSKLELIGRVVSLDVSNDGKNLCVMLFRRKSIIIELWDREQSLKLAESIHTGSSHKKFQVI